MMEENMPDLREQQIVEEFQRRRQVLLKNFVLAMILVALGLVLRQVVDSFPDLLGIPVKTWQALSIGQLMAGVVFAVKGFRQFKCPVCNEIPRGHDKYYLGVTVNPDKCPHCGTRLS